MDSKSISGISAMKATFQLIFSLLLAVVCEVAAAGVINFSYAGSTGGNGNVFSANGTGTFSFAGSPSTMDLSALRIFAVHVTITETTPASTYFGVFDYSLTDLLSFSA